MEKKESLKSSTLVSQLPDSIKNKIHYFLANSVMASSIVVSSVFLSIDKLLRVIQLAIGTTPGLVNHSGLQVNKDSSGDMFATTSLREESLEAVISKSFV